jgi:hypothetical protein
MKKFDTNIDECINKIVDPFRGDIELLGKMFESIKKIDSEYARDLESDALRNRPEFIHDALNQIIFSYIYTIIYTDLKINDVSIHDLESNEYTIEIKKTINGENNGIKPNS